VSDRAASSVICMSFTAPEGSTFASEKKAYRKGSGRHFVSDMPCHPPTMRVAFLASILLLAGCAVSRETVQPAMDYPPGAFYNRDGTPAEGSPTGFAARGPNPPPPKVFPCMAGALLCSPQGG